MVCWLSYGGGEALGRAGQCLSQAGEASQKRCRQKAADKDSGQRPLGRRTSAYIKQTAFFSNCKAQSVPTDIVLGGVGVEDREETTKR